MAINAADVKLMRAERNTDESDGGGMMTGTALVSGDINNLWADISQNLQARGGVSIRRLFGAIRAANTDMFLGSGFILTKDAIAPNISTMMFSTGDHYAERAEIQDKIEQYVVLSNRSPLRPVGTQRQGQTSIVVYADNVNDAPEVGEVLFLVDGADEQPVKVMNVDVRSASYTYVDEQERYQTYRAQEMTIRISQQLATDFAGVDPSPIANHPTEIFKTQSNNSAKYYGIRPLASDASAGDSSVTVDSIFQPIIPASTSETAYVDQLPGIAQKMVQPTSASIRTRSLGTLNGAQFITLPTAWVPGTLQVTVGGGVHDEADGGLRLLSGSEYLSDVSINPAAGTLAFTVSGSRSCLVSYIPGVAVELTPYTDSVLITAGNRQVTYTFQLAPPPSPGTLRVDFMYLGKWYSITDDGTGGLSGPGASGTINYATGSGSITLPGEPDLNSQIIYTWAQTPYEVADTGARNAWFELDLDDVPLESTLQIDWSRNASNYSETANASGVLSGSAGSITGNTVVFTPANLPTSDVVITYDKHNAAVLTASKSIAQSTGGSFTIDVGQTNIVPGSIIFDLEFTYTAGTLSGGTVYESRISNTQRLVSNAQGQLKARWMGSIIVGSIDYAAGIITVDGTAFTRRVPEYTEQSGVLGGWQQVTTEKTMRVEAQTASISYRSTTAGIPITQTIPVNELTLKMPVSADTLVPGSVVLSLDSDELVDRGDGVLYRAFNMTTAAGLTAGSIDSVNGMAEINYSSVRDVIDSLSGSLDAAALGLGAAVAVKSVVFRTAAAPLRSSGLQFLARRSTDGALMRAVSDNDGVITGAFDSDDTLTELPQPSGNSNGYVLPFVPAATTGGSASGSVDSIAGVVEITFTQPVILSTLTYNAVAYTTLPQDPERLGLNPVRLPTNGEVPVLQDGYLVVVHHTDTVNIASPIAGQVIDCGRTDCSVIVIKDALGALLANDQYTVNLAAGTATLADPFSAEDDDGNSLTLPLIVNHRIEDRAVITNASVTGQLQLNLQLTHDYIADESYVSAMVETGDLQARIKDTFFQKVDSTEWRDELIGDASVASYDDLNYPILIDSLGCVQDRWKLRFTSGTGFECVSEQRGVIGTGSINADFSPVNPMTGTPYFTIRSGGWGGGWVSSNVVRFNTDAAAAPVEIIRTVTPSNQQIADDSIVIEFMGDAD